MKLWELLDRPEDGPIPNDQFKAILAEAASEFEALPKKPPSPRSGSFRCQGRACAHVRYR